MLQVLHNPRCGKSRNCLAFLTEANQSFEIINYLQNPLSEDEIRTLLEKLNLKPIQLVRQKETVWIENYKDKTLSDNEIIKALSENPILIERPIVIKNDKAIIGRAIENLEKFI
ncbi:arsenate reductase family protein [Flavobacterium sp.]|uniref:arsenate reductase family protein n=1 Tax=Flavobacterium sp. TaxID=239 RepID=UPI0025D0503D|nr:arsenate reductase family protein [Flavobacterium sp.]